MSPFARTRRVVGPESKRRRAFWIKAVRGCRTLIGGLLWRRLLSSTWAGPAAPARGLCLVSQSAGGDFCDYRQFLPVPDSGRLHGSESLADDPPEKPVFPAHPGQRQNPALVGTGGEYALDSQDGRFLLRRRWPVVVRHRRERQQGTANHGERHDAGGTAPLPPLPGPARPAFAKRSTSLDSQTAWERADYFNQPDSGDRSRLF